MPIHCPICQVHQAENEKDLVYHQAQWHSDLNEGYWCPKCQLGFPTKPSFYAHAYPCQGHVVEAIRCFSDLEEAHQQYGSEGSSAERRDIDHYCNFCPNKFVNSKALVDHQRESHKEKMHFMCKKCGRGFEKKAERNEHRDAQIC